MVNEKKFNEWYKNSSDKVIKERIKSIHSKNSACVITCVIITALLFISLGYIQYKNILNQAVLTESFKMMGFMSAALEYCANQTNSTSKEMIIAYGRDYVDESFKKMEQTDEDCKYGCDNIKGAQI